MSVGYLMNTYPMTSTTFIGREIAALEALGLPIRRYAIRPWPEALVDPGDQREKASTLYLLTGPPLRLLRAMLTELIRNPSGFIHALRLMVRLMRNARGSAIKHLAYLAEAAVLCGMGRRDGITHFHAHFSTNSTVVAMLANAMGGPSYSFTVHGPDELLCPTENSIALKVEHARFVACISHFARSQVMLFSRQADWPKLEIVHCGVEPDRYGGPAQRTYAKRILFVGRLAAAKGVPLLLHAIAALHEAHPELSVTIVGDGPDRKALEAQAAATGIAAQVQLLGYQSQDTVTSLLNQHDMLVLPSFAEGVPVVLMEAMASRLPVIASRIAGVPELVEDGVAGFLVAPGDFETLTARLNQLLSDPALCAQMGKAGRKKVEAEFQIGASAGQLRILFETGVGIENLRGGI